MTKEEAKLTRENQSLLDKIVYYKEVIDDICSDSQIDFINETMIEFDEYCKENDESN